MNKKLFGLTLFLALTLLIGTFASCKSSQGSQDSTGKDSTQSENGGSDSRIPEVTEMDYESGDRLDPTLDYNNDVFMIYTWIPQVCNEWVVEDDVNLNIVDRALYTHLQQVKERLNLDIVIQQEKGRYSERLDFIKKLDSIVNVGMIPDLVCQYSLCASIGMLKGLYTDLLSYDHLDYDAPWWNQQLVEGNTINKKLYYLTGDVSPSVLYNMYGVMFNKKLVTDYKLEDPYELVKDGNWTFERMLELIANTSKNPNLNNEYESGDDVMYGLLLPKLSVDAFQTGFGITALEKTDEGKVRLTTDYMGVRASDMIDAIKTLAYQNEDVFYDREAKYGQKIFQDNKAIFMIDTMYYVERSVRDFEQKIGIVPVPKYDSFQENYATRVAVPTSLFSIPRGLKDPERSAAVLEALASDGYRNVTPVVFEKSFQNRYSDAPDDAEMFLIIRDSIIYDPGNFVDGLDTFSGFRNCVAYNSSWRTFLTDKMTFYTQRLVELNEFALGE